jgi:hypothetical protein
MSLGALQALFPNVYFSILFHSVPDPAHMHPPNIAADLSLAHPLHRCIISNTSPFDPENRCASDLIRLSSHLFSCCLKCFISLSGIFLIRKYMILPTGVSSIACSILNGERTCLSLISCSYCDAVESENGRIFIG